MADLIRYKQGGFLVKYAPEEYKERGFDKDLVALMDSEGKAYSLLNFRGQHDDIAFRLQELDVIPYDDIGANLIYKLLVNDGWVRIRKRQKDLMFEFYDKPDSQEVENRIKKFIRATGYSGPVKMDKIIQVDFKNSTIYNIKHETFQGDAERFVLPGSIAKQPWIAEFREIKI